MKILAPVLTTTVMIGTMAPLTEAVTANQQGNEIVINGNTITVPWLVRNNRLYVSDTGLMFQLGAELTSTSNYQTQRLNYNGVNYSVKAIRDRQYRYLDTTELWKGSGWTASGNRLRTATDGLVNNVTASGLGSDRAEIKIASNAPWRLSQDATAGFLTIHSGAQPSIVQAPATLPAAPSGNTEPGDEQNITNTSFKVTSSGNKTVVQFPLKLGTRARAIPTTQGIRIEVSPTAMAEWSIAWAPGLVWQQKWQSLNGQKFPLSVLELDPQKVSLRPILGQAAVIGSGSIGSIATNNGAAAAINAGYFNRNTRQPLGAIKVNGRWLSSPILGRGALGWQERSGWQMARLTYSEQIVGRGQPVTNNLLNSGYSNGAVGRYTSDWGNSYQPLTANELILTVQGGKVTQVVPNAASNISVAIPANGYLLVGRAGNPLADWAVGTPVKVTTSATPAAFNKLPNIIGAGPWLIDNRQIVLDAKGENFTGGFGTQMAARSAIAIDGRGKLLVVTVLDRVGGKGPTLGELAQLLQSMGAVNALNLDGGSSTSLFVGGQLVNRSPATTAKVNSVLGIFLTN
jgi:exopolysaccharide biosynthesis protein